MSGECDVCGGVIYGDRYHCGRGDHTGFWGSRIAILSEEMWMVLRGRDEASLRTGRVLVGGLLHCEWFGERWTL
jgi:hypothetical protein